MLGAWGEGCLVFNRNKFSDNGKTITATYSTMIILMTLLLESETATIVKLTLTFTNQNCLPKVHGRLDCCFH